MFWFLLVLAVVLSLFIVRKFKLPFVSYILLVPGTMIVLYIAGWLFGWIVKLTIEILFGMLILAIVVGGIVTIIHMFGSGDKKR